MDNDEPNRDNPYTDKEAPSLAKLRRDIELPKFKKSKTDRDDPNRTLPNNDIAEPK
jgi:hypothetical protein